jgi:hypothetical protein
LPPNIFVALHFTQCDDGGYQSKISNHGSLRLLLPTILQYAKFSFGPCNIRLNRGGDHCVVRLQFTTDCGRWLGIAWIFGMGLKVPDFRALSASCSLSLG